MPTLPHEALLYLVRAAPGVLLGLLHREFGLPWSARAQVTAAEFVDLDFAEYRADALFTLGPPEAPDEAVVLEVQLATDPRKRRTWPLYVTGPRARLGCPVTLVIVAFDQAVADWCAQPIPLGRGDSVIVPWVLGPRHIPYITDEAEARRCPELAVLSVAAHGHEPGAEHIAHAALTASRGLDNDRDLLYPDFILAMLDEVARAALEQLMQKPRQYYSEFARNIAAESEARGEARGEAHGKADLLLKLLRLKGLVVPPALQAEVLACQDLARLDAWAGRVLDARTLADVFGDAAG